MAVRSQSTACDDGTFMFPKESIAHKRNVYIQKKRNSFARIPLSKKVAMTYSPTKLVQASGDKLACTRNERSRGSYKLYKQKKTSNLHLKSFKKSGDDLLSHKHLQYHRRCWA